MKKPFRRALAAGSVAIGFAACSSTPDKNPALEATRTDINQLRSTPDARRLSGVQLDDAQSALERADTAWRAEDDAGEVDHLSMLAANKTQIAQNVMERRRAEQRIEMANAERNRILLANRDLQAQQAEAAKDLAQRENSQLRATIAQSQEKLAALNQQLRELSANQTDRGMVVTLSGVLFDTGNSSLKSGADRTLDRVARILRDNQERTILIEGFTDSTGGESTNQRLSQARADAVMIDLMRKGVARDRIRARGLGEAYPIASNDTIAGRQQNRRVELVISNGGGSIGTRDQTSRKN